MAERHFYPSELAGFAGGDGVCVRVRSLKGKLVRELLDAQDQVLRRDPHISADVQRDAKLVATGVWVEVYR